MYSLESPLHLRLGIFVLSFPTEVLYVILLLHLIRAKNILQRL